jgi:hypothetical protein
MSPFANILGNRVFAWSLSDSFVVGKKYFVFLLEYFGDNLCSILQVEANTLEDLGKLHFKENRKGFNHSHFIGNHKGFNHWHFKGIPKCFLTVGI